MAASTPLLRIARRAFLRDRWRALLVVVLIALPVAGITTAASLLQTAIPTPTERAVRTMGMADLLVAPLGPNGREELLPLLPDGSRMEPMGYEGDRAVLGGVSHAIEGRYVDLGGLGAGMATLLDGRLPGAPDEVAISTPLAARAAVGIGGTLELESRGTARVVGIVEDPRSLARLLVVGDPTLATASDRVPQWLVALPPGVSEEVVATDIGDALDPMVDDWDQPMFEAITRAVASEASQDFTVLVVLLGSLALVESALVAAAAFAVGIRRRQRELGVLGAAGATPRQLAGSVLAEGLVAGLVAVAAGIGVGLLLAWLLSLRLDDLTGSRAGPLELDPVVLLVAACVGLAAATIASAVPAWGASRLPTLGALSGRRPPSTPAHRLLLFGLALVVIAFACTAVAPMTGRTSDVLPLALLVAGAVTGVLGFGACSPWLLERLEGVARRLPLAPRIALRDTARARTRNGPIVTAVLASVAATIALSAVLASQEARSQSFWRPTVASDSLMIQGNEAAGARVAQELGAIGHGPDRWAHGPDGSWDYEIVMPLLHPNPAADTVDHGAGFLVGDERLLIAYHGEVALDAFRTGATVVLESPEEDPEFDVTGSTGTVARTDWDEYGNGRRTELGEVTVVRVPARGDTMMATMAVMPSATARSFGLVLDDEQTQYLVRLDHEVTQADLDRAGAVATAVDPQAYINGPLPPPDPMIGFRLLMLAAAILAALTVTGVAVALGEAEARADQRTLLALGAAPGSRRRMTASRAAVIAALAGLLAVPAGLLPVWGVLVPLEWPMVVPLPEVVGALVVLPLAAIAGGLLLGRPLPAWAALRDHDT
jgi:putative ABC transport system permease protein